ncbi:hypothetical protein [Streptomyces sp. ME109]|uniref:hypothetical protein n=1 Tax=Streptomyces sp. me109 TaxID=1827853 RepID=UPI001651237F|nr:hypothetical protein [Streptomyces sp. me109]
MPAEIPDHTNRTRTSSPAYVSSPWNTPRPSLPNAPVTGGNSFPLRLEDQFSDHTRASGSNSRRVSPFQP